MLGYEAKDIITNQRGIISSVSFDLYGCIQVLMTPTQVKEGEDYKLIGWNDINRIKINKQKKKIMAHPDYKKKYNSLDEVGGACMKKPI